jgi:phosphomevalonate kinase
MPSGKMFFGALLFAILLESSCGAVGAAEVKAGAMMSIEFGYYTEWRSQLIELPKDQSPFQGFQDKELYSLKYLMRSGDS